MLIKDLDDSLIKNLLAVRQRIKDTAIQYDRNPSDISLVLVSKGQPVSKIVTAFKAGERAYGENYLQEALKKITALGNSIHPEGQIKTPEYNHFKPPEWHFIGQLQSNKLKEIALYFDWVQSVDSIKKAKLLNDYRAQKDQKIPTKPPLNILIQVKRELGAIDNKYIDSLTEMANAIKGLPHLCFRGLMYLPTQKAEFAHQRKSFRLCHKLFLELKAQFPSVDTLSMGMSMDFEAAIAEGSTMVRIGSAIFGQRDLSD